MDDKTSSTRQPSTAFDDSSVSTTHSRSASVTTSSAISYPSSSINTILSNINHFSAREPRTPSDARNSMLSPPEPRPLDSFTPAASGIPMESAKKGVFSPDRFLPSPPVSPETKTVTTVEDLNPTTGPDPILYPGGDSRGNASSQPPLFTATDNERLRVIDGHVAAREQTVFREASPPRQSEYQLALEFKSQVAQAFDVNRKLWYQRELAQLREDSALRPGGRRYTNIAPANPGGRPVRQAPKVTTSRSNGTKVVKHRTPKPQVTRGDTPGPRPAREDKDFDSLPDYCPPISSLPSRPNSLKVEWRGTPIDLKSDPHAHLLDPDELLLAGNLRLDCATYLTSKRRIFIKRIDALRIGKEFRKTDAQQACKIDVNKASKLWTAFEKVGWLNSKWVVKYV